MPTTTNGAPYPALTDAPQVPADIQELAEWTDKFGLLPIGDPQYSQTLAPLGSGIAAPDLRLPVSTTTDILTSTFTLTRQQYVLLAAQVRIIVDPGGNAVGIVGLAIDVDGAVPTLGYSGPMMWGSWEDSASSGSANNIGATNTFQMTIPQFSVLLAAGSHTVKLQADRDASNVFNVQTNTTFNGRAYKANKLVVIV